MRAARDTDPAVSVLGTLVDGVVGSGGEHGLVRVDAAGIEIDWWIGADDGWSIPSDGAAHTIRPGVAPAIETRVRVPGGETVLRAYAAAGAATPLIVAELENASPGAVVIAWVVRAAPGYRIGRVSLAGSTLLIDERAVIDLPVAPTRWSVAARSTGVRDAVLGGRAATGRFEPVVTRRGDLEVAVLFPVAHRTRTRIAATTALVPAGAATHSISERRNLAGLPALADVERGWVAALEQGTQLELPDESLQASADAARATLLLGGPGRQRRDRAVTAAARAWGLAATPDRARSRVGRHDADGNPWPGIRATAAFAGSSPRRAAEWLAALRGALVRVDRNDIELLPNFPVEWLGRSVAVDELPIAGGRLSFALRWHGARPALLWDAPPGLRVMAPSLDAAWAGGSGAGEALLAEIDATRLLPLQTAPPDLGDIGVVVDDPGSFM